MASNHRLHEASPVEPASNVCVRTRISTEQEPLLQSERTLDDFVNDDSESSSSSSSEVHDNHLKRDDKASPPLDTLQHSIHKLQDDDDVPIMEVMEMIDRIDTIEDEMEAHTYEEIVPLDVKLALEDKVFGWSHLSSTFLGHTAFTGGAYFVVYLLVTQLLVVRYDTDLVYLLGGYPLQYAWFNTIRGLLSVMAAVSTFRMVRRRRRVWFRAPYGSRAYQKDQARRIQSVRESDRTTLLGRMRYRRDAMLERRLHKKLEKAATRFAKRKQHRERQARERWLARSDSQQDASSTGSTASTVSTTEGRTRLPSFHTIPTNSMHSIMHDQILFQAGPIQNMPYAHGGFFGAAPFMLANPHWISILRHLMPDVYVELSRRVTKNPPEKLIHWAENNPVVAAYGTAHELEYNPQKQAPTLEWDVFLDPHLAMRVERVLEERDKWLASHKDSASGNILKYYEQELKTRSQLLVDKMLIAHGNLTQIILEQTGYCRQYNYSRVKRTRRTLGGGIYARQWMAVYAEALKMGVCMEPDHNNPDNSSSEEEDESSNLVRPNKELKRRHSTTLDALAASQCPDSSIANSIVKIRSIVKQRSPLGLVLDMKSRHVPRRVWAAVVDTLRASGVRVDGVASFTVSEIRDISRYCQAPVKEKIFFHSAGDLQRACHDGRIRKGDIVFFNAGSLLWDPETNRSWNDIVRFDPTSVQTNYKILPFGQCSRPKEAVTSSSTIEAYKVAFDLSVGMYCQEFAIDEAAANLLVQLVNENSHVYDQGLSWGGVNGITIRGIQPGRFTSTDGFWNQRYIGEVWDSSLVPPTTLDSTE